MEYSDFEDISLGEFSFDFESWLIILDIFEMVILVMDFIYLSLGFWVVLLKLNEVFKLVGVVVSDEYQQVFDLQMLLLILFLLVYFEEYFFVGVE